MEKEERLAFRPQLLLLAPFLATLDVFVANLRVVRDITGAPESFGAVAVSMLVACALAGLVFILVPSVRGVVCHLTRRRALAAAVIYSMAQAGFWWLAVAAQEVSTGVLGALGAVMGCCLIPLFMAWLACYNMGFRSILFHGGLAAIGSALIVLVILLLDPVVAAVCWCLCTLVGSWPLRSSGLSMRLRAARWQRHLRARPPRSVPMLSPSGHHPPFRDCGCL